MKMKKLPLLAVLFTVVVVVSASGVTWTSDAASAGVVYFDLAVDESRQLLYGSDLSGGSIHAISMATLDVVSTLGVGSQPVGLDMSPDGDELAVALYGQGEIAFVALDTFSVISRTVPAGTFGPNQPYDVLYGRPGRLYSVGNPGSYGLDYVHAFDTNTKLEVGRSSQIVRSKTRLAMTADKNTLYVSEASSSPQYIYRFDISSDTPTQTAATPHGPVAVETLCVLSDRVYTSLGQVWSADLTTQLGTFAPDGSEIECSESLQKIYISTASRFSGIDAVGLGQVFGLDLGYTVGVARLDGAEKRLYVSTADGVKVIGANIKPWAYLPLAAGRYCPDFYDDFHTASGWFVGDDDYVRTEYLGGEYRILAKRGGYLYLFGAPTCDRESYTVTVDARWEGKPDGGYGILFGMQDDYSHYYFFDVNADYQAFRLYRRGPDGFTPLAVANSSAIHAGRATNRLAVTRDGSQITLYANGVALGTWWDGEITGLSSVGLVSSAYTNGPASDARFDNFSVVSLPTDGARARSSEGTDAKMPEPRATENQIEPAPTDLHW